MTSSLLDITLLKFLTPMGPSCTQESCKAIGLAMSQGLA